MAVIPTAGGIRRETWGNRLVLFKKIYLSSSSSTTPTGTYYHCISLSWFTSSSDKLWTCGCKARLLRLNLVCCQQFVRHRILKNLQTHLIAASWLRLRCLTVPARTRCRSVLELLTGPFAELQVDHQSCLGFDQ